MQTKNFIDDVEGIAVINGRAIRFEPDASNWRRAQANFLIQREIRSQKEKEVKGNGIFRRGGN